MSCRYLHNDMPAPGLWHRLWCSECRAARSADATLSLGVACMKAQTFPEAGMKRALTSLGLPASPYQHKRRLGLLRRRILLPAGTVMLFLTLAGGGWLYYIDRNPTVSIPMPTMPDPNAHDIFLEAAQVLIDEEKIGKALNLELKEYDLRKLAKRAAEHQPVRSTASLEAYLAEVQGPLTLTEEEQRSALDEMNRLVDMNKSALETLRQGLKFPYQEPPLRSMHTLLPHYAKFRSLARLLALDAHVKAARGDWKGAAKSGLDAIQLGTQIPRGGVLIGKLVGIACQAIGRDVLWQTVEHLNAQEAREVAERLETIKRFSVPFEETLQEEKWAGLAMLQNDILVPGWRWDSSLKNWHTEESYRNEAAFYNALWYLWSLRYSKRQIVENYRQYMDNAIAQARVSIRKSEPEDVPTDPINQILLPVFSGAGLQELSNATQNNLLLTTLALRAYRLEKGAYPRDWLQLNHRYIRSIPTDVFHPYLNKLRYWSNGQTYKLYSVGPDQKDDGGVPVSNPERREPERYNVGWESVGDIVAGKNLK